MTSSEFADSQGFSPAYVTKLVQQGIIQRDADGQINEAEAIAALEARRDPAKQLRRGRPPVSIESTDNGGLSTLLLKSRIKSEVERGKLAELDRRKREGELVPAQDVRDEQLRRAIEEREALLNWPSRIGALMAVDLEIEQQRLLPVLRKYVRQHLAERAASLPAELPKAS